MMPQKRNPYLLEHVKGKAAAAGGAFATATTAMHATPFTNNIAVGTEAVRHFWGALADTTDAVVLTRSVVEGIEPDPVAMSARATAGFTTATALAEHLVVHGDMPFREAHRRVGEAVTLAVAKGHELADAAVEVLDGQAHVIRSVSLEPAAVRAAARHGGGPAAEVLRAALTGARAESAELAASLRARQQQWDEAAGLLDAAEQSLREARG
jgi:argininosuccinate lyase